MYHVENKSKAVLGQGDARELWEEIVSHIPDEVFLKKDLRILNVACGHAVETRAIIKRMELLGISEKKIRESIWLNDKYSCFTSYWKQQGFNVVEGDFLEWKTNMKFDVVIGNPPYQDKEGNEDSSNSKRLYARFTKKARELTRKYLLFVVPSVWLGPKTTEMKEFFLHQAPLTAVRFLDDSVFKVGVPICYFVWEPNRQSKATQLIDKAGRSSTVDLSAMTFIPTDVRLLSVLGKVCSEEGLDHFWIRGLASVKEIESRTAGQHHVVVGVNGKSKTKIFAVKDRSGTAGYGYHKVIMPNTMGTNNFGVLKYSPPSESINFSVVALTAKNKKEALILKDYLNSKLVRAIIAGVKITGPNSKSLFTTIPVLDFSRTWTDEELYKHFKLTKEEIKYIEDNVK